MNGVFALNDKPLFPFERNRYYIGKLLTSLDFQAEQTYLNNKRNFLNKMLFGGGILCGLGCYNLDDATVMVESGAALDSLGRELVLEKSVVRKLSAISGFEGLKSERASLCLRYGEEAVRPVYAISRQSGEEEYEMNRIREGVELFLADADAAESGAGIESEFLSRVLLYSGGDYSAELSLPSAVPCGGRVRLCLTVEKLSEAPLAFAMECALQLPAFTAEDGGHEVRLAIESTELKKGSKITKEAWLSAQEQPVDSTVVIAGAGGTVFHIGGQRDTLSENRMLQVAVEELSPEDIIAREIGKISLENREAAAKQPYVRLADFILQRSQTVCIIERVIEAGAESYLPTAADAALRREYSAYYGAKRPLTAIPTGTAAEKPEPYATREPLYATGMCEIPLDPPVKAGYVFYSDEIMHGLGAGNVYVTVGFEYLSDDKKTLAPAQNTIYGAPGLFDEEEALAVCAETAVKVMNDRGSFMAAAMLTRETKETMLVLRWVAIKLPSAGDPLNSSISGRTIAAVQPTAVLAARESLYFAVSFRNMEPCTLTYALTERASGSITPDGVYTAPAKEGVYEIKITCAGEPGIFTYAYAVVKKGGAAEETPQE